MIESKKQMKRFIEKYTPILNEKKSITIRMELPSPHSKSKRALIHRSFTIAKMDGFFYGYFKGRFVERKAAGSLEHLLIQLGVVLIPVKL